MGWISTVLIVQKIPLRCLKHIFVKVCVVSVLQKLSKIAVNLLFSRTKIRIRILFGSCMQCVNQPLLQELPWPTRTVFLKNKLF
jgi:hypothetical protein